MSESNRAGDVVFAWDRKPMWIACRLDVEAMPPCAYCRSESTRSCDAPGNGGWGRCGVRMCKAHTTKVGEHHDLCRQHAQRDRLAMIKAGEVAQNVWWEIVETKAVPIPGPDRPQGTYDPIPRDHRSRRRAEQLNAGP